MTSKRDVLHITAIDVQVLPDGEAGDRTGEEYHGGGHILRLAQTPDDAVRLRVRQHRRRLLPDTGICTRYSGEPT